MLMPLAVGTLRRTVITPRLMLQFARLAAILVQVDDFPPDYAAPLPAVVANSAKVRWMIGAA